MSSISIKCRGCGQGFDVNNNPVGTCLAPHVCQVEHTGPFDPVALPQPAGGGVTLEELRSELAPVRKALNLVVGELLDPWEKLHSETESTIEAAERLNLGPVSSYYGMQKKSRCMVLGKATHCQIKCAHIWPKYTMGNGLEAFDLSNADVNNPRNFLRLHSAIERAFDYKRLVFVPECLTSTGALVLKVVLLDPALFGENLSFNNATIKFSEIHNKLFAHAFLPEKMPFTRLLANHIVQAMNKAKSLGWIPEGDPDAAAARSRAIEMARRSLGEDSLCIKAFFGPN
eukprot:gene34620-41924_t